MDVARMNGIFEKALDDVFSHNEQMLMSIKTIKRSAVMAQHFCEGKRNCSDVRMFLRLILAELDRYSFDYRKPGEAIAKYKPKESVYERSH